MNKSIVASAIAGGLTAVALSLGMGAAHAETGTKPHIDPLCFDNQAYVSSGPVVIIRNDIRQERKFETPLVGLRAQNDYCSGPDVVLPPSYGSGPADVVVVP